MVEEDSLRRRNQCRDISLKNLARTTLIRVIRHLEETQQLTQQSSQSATSTLNPASMIFESPIHLQYPKPLFEIHLGIYHRHSQAQLRKTSSVDLVHDSLPGCPRKAQLVYRFVCASLASPGTDFSHAKDELHGASKTSALRHCALTLFNGMCA